MSNDKLTMDLKFEGLFPYTFSFDFKSGSGIDLSHWDFRNEFGVLEERILSEIGETLFQTFKNDPPFTLDLPQLCCFHEEPEWPLTVTVGFSVGTEAEQMIFTHSLEQIVAIAFDMERYGDDGTYDAPFTKRAMKFRDALRELADKMDVEIQKGRTE